MKPLFMVDHMLIKLGKYLRILGYDAAWSPSSFVMRTHDLIVRANAEGRIFLTRNSRIPHQYPAPDKMLAVSETDPVLQLKTVVATLGLDEKTWLFSRCIRCNVELGEVADKQTIESRVHPNVYARHDRFFTCPSCGTVFWHGSHVTNTCEKLRDAVGRDSRLCQQPR
jgi:hypothetical protein